MQTQSYRFGYGSFLLHIMRDRLLDLSQVGDLSITFIWVQTSFVLAAWGEYPAHLIHRHVVVLKGKASVH